MPIEDWMPTLKANMEGVTGIVRVYDYSDLPGDIIVFPSLIILPTSGEQQVGVNIAYHHLQLTLYVAPGILPQAFGKAVPFIKLIRDKLLANITLGGLVDQCLPAPYPGRWYSGPGALKYGDTDKLGIIFYVDVKENPEALTVQA